MIVGERFTTPPVSSGRASGGFYKRRPPFRRRACRVCVEWNGHVDWKSIPFLRSFVTDSGKVLPGRTTGTCQKCQRQLTSAIKRARNLAMLPVVSL